MFHFGFSYIGLLWLLMLFVPNILWAKRKPEHYDTYAQKEKKVLLLFERIGEVLVCICVLSFSDFNIRRTYWIVWLIIAFALLLLYEIYWIRYFKSKRTMQDFYSSIAGIPVAGATLPVCSFFLLGIYGSNIFLLFSVIILGIGHIGIHLGHRKEVCTERRKKKLPVRILQWVAAFIFVSIFGVITFVIGCRNLNYLKHYRMINAGVDEGIYLSLGGQEQYVLMRGMNKENPVIIYLHGGPSSPDTYITYGFTDYLLDDYTIVAWDQRGCGRTYFKNMDTDAENTTADFEQAIEDLDALVDYACERFGQKQVILMGHSYGTILGSEYAICHPDKVSAYIGVAQVVSLEKSDVYSYEDALKKAAAAGEDAEKLTAAFAKVKEDESLTNLMELRTLVSEYHPVEVTDKTSWMAVTSPYFGMDDFRWFVKQLGSMEAYYGLNRQLFDYTFSFDAYENGLEYKMPVYFISGSCDWICPVDSINEYMGDLYAPSVDWAVMEGCGHNIQYSLPEEFAQNVKRLLEQ